MTEVDFLIKKFAKKAIDKFDYVKVDRPMGQNEIAENMGVSHTLIGKNLKSGMTKIYENLRRDTDLEPFEICVRMSKMFGVPEDLEEEVKSFIRCFPEEIKGEILRNAKKRIK